MNVTCLRTGSYPAFCSAGCLGSHTFYPLFWLLGSYRYPIPFLRLDDLYSHTGPLADAVPRVYRYPTTPAWFLWYAVCWYRAPRNVRTLHLTFLFSSLSRAHTHHTHTTHLAACPPHGYPVTPPSTLFAATARVLRSTFPKRPGPAPRFTALCAAPLFNTLHSLITQQRSDVRRARINSITRGTLPVTDAVRITGSLNYPALLRVPGRTALPHLNAPHTLPVWLLRITG